MDSILKRPSYGLPASESIAMLSELDRAREIIRKTIEHSHHASSSFVNDQFMNLGYHVYVLATQSPDVDRPKPILYASVLVLLRLTFTLNFLAIVLRIRAGRAARA